jgi:hypothetical protein
MVSAENVNESMEDTTTEEEKGKEAMPEGTRLLSPPGVLPLIKCVPRCVASNLQRN